MGRKKSRKTGRKIKIVQTRRGKNRMGTFIGKIWLKDQSTHRRTEIKKKAKGSKERHSFGGKHRGEYDTIQ